MHKPLIAIGVIGYIMSGLVWSAAPTVMQEIASLLIATNATLFFVGGIALMDLKSDRSPTITKPKTAHANVPYEDPRWGDRVR